MTKILVTASAATALLLAACQPPGVIHKTSRLGEHNVLAVDANQRLVLEGVVDGERIVCTEPSPDAVAAHAAQLAATANATLANGQAAGASLAAGYSQSVASLAMRTQTIQVLRDGYFRLCEARMNNLIDKANYQVIVAFIDEFIATVAAIEAIGGTVQVAPIAVYAGGDATAGKDNADVDGKPSQQAQIPAIVVDTSKVDNERAKVIADILKEYYDRKAAFHRLLIKNALRSG